jgi:hypothetical protein
VAFVSIAPGRGHLPYDAVGNYFKIFSGHVSILSYPRCTIEHMLPASLFAPLDLPAMVEDVRRTEGAHGVVDLLVVTLTDSQVRTDVDIDEHLGALLAACRQTHRYREAIPVLERVATLNPDRRHEMAAELALIHAHLGERSQAVAMLESAVAQHHQLPVSRRSLAFSLVAEVAALLLRLPDLAQRCAALGRSTATVAPTRTRKAAPAGRKERATSPGRAERSTAPERAPAPRRRTGLARPVLASQPTLGEIETEPAATARPILTLIAGSAA